MMLVDLGPQRPGPRQRVWQRQSPHLMFVESYSHVMHLVSALEGTLRQELDRLDALAACFPAGTLSGAPKVRAMEIIEELEPVRRGVYGGSICTPIRPATWIRASRFAPWSCIDGRAYVQAGAGIVADSDPASEYQECMNKASALLRAAEKVSG